MCHPERGAEPNDLGVDLVFVGLQKYLYQPPARAV